MRHDWPAHHRSNQSTAMNKDNAAQFIPLVQALADGKTIQIDTGAEQSPYWVDIVYVTFDSDPEKYRIKPEAREWKAVVIKDTVISRNAGLNIGSLTAYDECDENNPNYEVVRVREILD